MLIEKLRRAKAMLSGETIPVEVRKMLAWRMSMPGDVLFDSGSLARRISLAQATTDIGASQQRKKSGNYRKGRYSDRGLTIAIENPRGSVRSGISKDGKPWSTLMSFPYGFVAKAGKEFSPKGADGDNVDVFLGDNYDSNKVFIIDQYVDGKFDEHKAMLYFNDKSTAEYAYKSCYDPGWDGVGGVTEMSWDDFKAWCRSGDCTKPLAPERAQGIEGAILKQWQSGDDMYIYGVVLTPLSVDRHENWAYEDEIRKACRRFMDSQQGGLQHRAMVPRAGMKLTQNFIAPADFTVDGLKINKGAWVVEFKVEDKNIQEAIRAGRYKGFSIGGKAKIYDRQRPDGIRKQAGDEEYEDWGEESVEASVAEMLDDGDVVQKADKPKKVTLNKPFRTPGGPKKFAVYVKNDQGNVVIVRFGDPNMEIKRDDPERRKNYRARHQCDTNPGPKWKANYWSCKMWASTPVGELT
jgi:hypothetical protein